MARNQLPGPAGPDVVILKIRPVLHLQPLHAVLVVFSVAGLVFLLLLAALSVAYLALPGGRFCPRCGGPTHPVLLRRWPRSVKRLLQWRWCAECGWEGLGRPPRRPDPGRRFHWRAPDASSPPRFEWSREEERDARAREEPPAGTPPPAEALPAEPPPPAPGPYGFRWKRPDDQSGPAFFWGGAGDEEPGSWRGRGGVLVRILRWLRSGEGPPSR